MTRRMTTKEAARRWGYPPPMVWMLRVFFPWLFDVDDAHAAHAAAVEARHD